MTTTRCFCIACWITKATDTNSLYLICTCSLSKAKIVKRKYLNVMTYTYLHCLCCTYRILGREFNAALFRSVRIVVKTSNRYVISVCTFVLRLSACFSVISTGRISVKLGMCDVYENCRENPNLVKIEQKYWVLHMETQACCISVAATHAAQPWGDCIVAFPWQRFQYFFTLLLKADVPQRYKETALLHFRGNNAYVKAPICCIIHTVAFLLLVHAYNSCLTKLIIKPCVLFITTFSSYYSLFELIWWLKG
jgi:hypothetical protein